MSELRPDQAAWERLALAQDRAGYAQAWLELQCQQIPGVSLAVVVMRPDREADSFHRAAVFPPGAEPDLMMQELAERCAEQRRGQAVPRDGSLDIAYPLLRGERLEGIVALRCPPGAPEPIMAQLQWGTGWIVTRLALEELESGRGRSEQLGEVASALAALDGTEHHVDASRVLATRLAALLACDRVSVGFRPRGDSRIAAVSHMAITPEHMNLVRSVEGVMDEAADQDVVLASPGEVTVPPRVLLEHERHRREHGVAALLTVPFHDPGGRAVGAICLERGAGAAFDEAERALAVAMAGSAGAVLELRRRDERWLGAKAWDAAHRQLSRLLGGGHLRRKLVAIVLLTLTFLAVVVHGEFRVTADSRLEGAVLRSISSPLDGFVDVSPVRAGDRVSEGELLAQLDDRDLQLERLALESEQTQVARQLQEARARGARADASVLSAQLAQLEAQIDLADEQIRRMRIVAPFDGLIIEGDLSQALGAAVARGDLLFQLAPLSGYRVILQVPEADVDHLSVGQEGELLLAPLTDRSFPLRIERITSVTVTAEGENRFEVQAALLTDDERLRPGMEGVAKIAVGERRVVWIWTRRFTDWLRLTLWRYGP